LIIGEEAMQRNISIILGALVIYLIIAIAFSMILSPMMMRPLALIIIIGGIGLASIISISRCIQEYRSKLIDRYFAICKFVIEESRIIVGVVWAAFAANYIEMILYKWSYQKVNIYWPGLGNTISMLMGIIVGIATGWIVSLAVHRLFSFLLINGSKATIHLQ
jgi:hypothetical protein